jgi:hypothetical protein
MTDVDELLALMLRAWVSDIESVPFPTIQPPEGQPR